MAYSTTGCSPSATTSSPCAGASTGSLCFEEPPACFHCQPDRRYYVEWISTLSVRFSLDGIRRRHSDSAMVRVQYSTISARPKCRCEVYSCPSRWWLVLTPAAQLRLRLLFYITQPPPIIALLRL